MASMYVQIVATIIFVQSWTYMAFHVKYLPLGRTLGTMLGQQGNQNR